ncbi:MAG: prepilin-type N-terminal cleavage/methylation domain-containing protein [Colwellia sp.]
MHRFCNTLNTQKVSQQLGFTLIELIIVVIILGILSVSVVPKFFSGSGFSEYGYRADVIAKLRLIQTRAMQQGSGGCYQVMITSNKLGKVTCDPSPEFVNQEIQRATTVEVLSEDPITFSPSGKIFIFDSMGRPQTGNVNEAITITVSGEQSLRILIESEGYIHAI